MFSPRPKTRAIHLITGDSQIHRKYIPVWRQVPHSKYYIVYLPIIRIKRNIPAWKKLTSCGDMNVVVRITRIYKYKINQLYCMKPCKMKAPNCALFSVAHIVCCIFPWKIYCWKYCSVYIAINQLKYCLCSCTTGKCCT